MCIAPWLPPLIVATTLALHPVAGLARAVDIRLKDVPESVLEAARKAVPGIRLTEAEVNRTKAGTVYEIEGRVGDIEYELLITDEGKVIDIEQDDDDESS